jgi:hypothetical protein
MGMAGMFVIVRMFVSVAGVDTDEVEKERSNPAFGPDAVSKLA